jgi:hypothetical protein
MAEKYVFSQAVDTNFVLNQKVDALPFGKSQRAVP